MRGCKCRKGCTTARYGCQKKGSYCGPGCYCTDCTNTPTNASCNADNMTESSDSDTDTDEDLETEIITDTRLLYY